MAALPLIAKIGLGVAGGALAAKSIKKALTPDIPAPPAPPEPPAGSLAASLPAAAPTPAAPANRPQIQAVRQNIVRRARSIRRRNTRTGPQGLGNQSANTTGTNTLLGTP